MRFKVSISKKAALITAAAVAGIVVASAVGFIIVCKRKASKEIKERLDNNEIDESSSMPSNPQYFKQKQLKKP